MPRNTEIPQEQGHHELRAHLAELYWRTITRPIPPDQILGYYFRKEGSIAQKARGFLAAALYDLLRERMRLHALISNRTPYDTWNGCMPLPVVRPEDETIAALSFWLWRQYSASENDQYVLFSNLIPLWRELAEEEDEGRRYPNPNQIDHFIFTAIPTVFRNKNQVVWDSGVTADLAERWKARFGEEDFEALVKEFNRPAPLDLRINTLKITRDKALEVFAENDIQAVKTSLSLDGIRLDQKKNVFRLQAFEEGCFEVQDAGSQLVGFACNAKPTWRVLDACSGAGGKSLHLSALMKNRGEIFAHDSEADRLQTQKKRLKRSGSQNVRLIDPGTAPDHGPYDLVLIDAPCLGFGTLRRNPDFLWRGILTERLTEIAQMQSECLNDYAPLVKPGGVLVYVTCSFEPEETIDLLKNHPLISENFQPDPLAPHFHYYNIHLHDLEKNSNSLTLLPNRHHTDGFFIARYKRKT